MASGLLFLFDLSLTCLILNDPGSHFFPFSNFSSPFSLQLPLFRPGLPLWLVPPYLYHPFYLIHPHDPLHIYKIHHTVFRFSHSLTFPLPPSRPGLPLWQVPPPTFFFLPHLHKFISLHRPSQILTDPSRILTDHIDTHRPLTEPYRSSHFLSLICYPFVSLIGPACHCGRSRLLPPSNSIYINLFHFTDLHGSPQIPTLLPYLAGPACHRGRSRLIPSHTPFAQVYSPSQILTDLYNSFTDPHRSSQFLSLVYYPINSPIGPACHCGRSRLLHYCNSIYIKFTPLHRSSPILTNPYPTIVPTLPFIFPYRSSQTLTEPPRSSQISTTPSQILTDLHIFFPLLTTPLFIYRPVLSLW